MLYYTELMNSLKRDVLAPVYLFYGNETYLIQQAVGHFVEHFSGGEDPELNCEIVDGEAVEAAEIVVRAEAAPFFTEKRLMIVKNPSFFHAKPADKKAKKAQTGEEEEGNIEEKSPVNEKTLLDYLENPMPTTCLIFIAGASLDKRKKLFRTLSKNGRTVEFAYLKKPELHRWLNQKAQNSGKKINYEAAEVLIKNAGPALQNLAMEWEKLDNYTTGQEVITPADVGQLVTPAVEDNIFVIMDAIGQKRCWEALRDIRELLLAKESPQRLLGMIARQFRLLLQISDLSGRGCTEKEIISRLKLHPYVYQKIANQKKNFNQIMLVEILSILSDLEKDIKTGRQEFYPALETLLLRISLEN